MTKRKNNRFGYAICINNEGYPASLERNKVYRILNDARAAKDDYLRVIDESGEDYLYPSKFFIVLKLPTDQAATLRRSIVQAS